MPHPLPAEPTRTYRGGKGGWVRPEERLARWGLRQHRQVTTDPLHSAGWSDRVISSRVDAGRLHAVFSGVFSLGGPPRTQREWWMAAVLTFGPSTRLSDVAGAELYGWVRYPLDQLHVTTPTERSPREGITPHHRTRSTTRRVIDHIPVTGPEQTILDCAGTIRSDALLRRIIRIAQAEKATSHARLLAFSALHRGARGVARLKSELAEGPSPTRSANEDTVLELLRHGGQILANHDIGGDEVDIYLPEHRVVIEVDSPLHDNPAARKHDAAKQARLEARGLRVYRLR